MSVGCRVDLSPGMGVLSKFAPYLGMVPSKNFLQICYDRITKKENGEGIGRRLMRFVLESFEHGIFTVETGVDNIPAIQLYEKMGFREIKQYDTNFGIRKIRLEKGS